jgi:hypothetical protein
MGGKFADKASPRVSINQMMGDEELGWALLSQLERNLIHSLRSRVVISVAVEKLPIVCSAISLLP